MGIKRPVLYLTPIAPRVGKIVTQRTGLSTPGALGRPKPAVVGTGRVDGIPVYGLSKVVTTNYRGVRLSSGFTFTYPEPTSVATIDVGYLLCKDYFRRGYSLIRLEADGEVVFDAENGAIPKIEFRFYNGLQTAVDPITTQVVGAANAGAHTGDVLIFLPDYPSLTAPVITAVISNAATDVGGVVEIAWTGEAPVNLNNTNRSAYDPVDGRIYQVLTTTEIPSLTTCYLTVLDVDTETELYRVPLEDSSFYVSSSAFIMALRGTGYVVIRLANSGETTSPTRIYNASTGQIVAEWHEDADESIRWLMCEPLDDKWLLVGNDVDGSGGGGTILAVIDIAMGSFDVTRNAVALGASFFSLGRLPSGSASFFVHGGSTCTEITYNGDTWSTATAYTSVGTVTAIHYDPLTEYLVVLEEIPSGTYNVQLVTPDTGALAEAFTISTQLFPLVDNLTCDRAFPRPGFALFRSSSEKLWAIDVSNHTATLLDDIDAQTGQDARWGFYDQARLSYFMASGDTIWTKYTLPGTQPGEISLESHISDILVYLGPYTIDQIRFSGFDGLSDWGDVIDKDRTNIRNLLRSYQDPLGFVWADIGSEIYFRKTPTDGSFVVDETLIDTDLVFKKDGSILSDDESDITRVARVSLEYNSKDDNYQARTVTADAFSALYEVTRSTREEQFETSLTLSDEDGERLVNEILWNIQAKERTHRFSTYAEFAKLIPGDVISVPSGSISYTVEIAKVNIKENLVVEIEARDFQTSLSADVAAVTNSGYSGISTVTLQSQYIHMDIPLLRLSDDASGASIVQYGVVASRGQPNWGGGSLYRGDTSSAFLPMFDQAANDGFIGVCATALPDMPNAHAGDFTNSIVVQKLAGDGPTDATEAEVLLGANLAFIGKDGRWEGVGFTTAVDNGDGTFTISGFAVRGWRGTEVYASQHAAGDMFVLASPDWVQKLLHPLTDLASTKYYKAVGFGGLLTSVIAESHVVSGEAEKPYAVVNIASELAGGDTTVTFDYRSRLSAWEMFSVAPDCGEDTLSFQIDVMDAGSPNTALHTYTVATNAWTYTAAQKTTDWGSPPAEATIRIYMISAAVGRGHVAEATISL
ncbi:MAG: hypothetical protein E5W82_10865 [Mesorhizobium sp.]|nr:MAG: hypothetical protein E5W82_10865 [Mesorhizobium sp.]